MTDNGGLESSDTCVASVEPSFQLQESPALHVSNISIELEKKGRNHKAIAHVTIVEDSGNIVEGATVIGEWTLNGKYLSTSSSSTHGNGIATLVSNPSKVKSGYICSITITDVVKDGFIYDPIDGTKSATVP